MSQLLQIHKKYPFMIPQCDFTLWNGVIIIKEIPVTVIISVPNYPSLVDLNVSCNASHANILLQKFPKPALELEKLNLLDFLDYLNNDSDFQSYMLPTGFTTVAWNFERSSKTNLCDKYKQVILEIKDIGAENVSECNGDFGVLKLMVVDEREEEHYLVLSVPENYPQSAPTIMNIDLPDVVVAQINQATSIKDIFFHFKSIITSLQEFWQAYEMLQHRTWIVDPEHPKKKDTYCRIVINDNVSVLLTFNPLDVSSCPDIKFLGSDSAVVPLRTTVEENLKEHGWDEELSIFNNLLIILGLDTFPQRTEEEVVDGALFQAGECCICFTLRLEDDLLPTKICNNPKCSSFYHLTCLSQWFQSIPTNEPSFNLISGDCPCCGERILCPIQLS